MIITEILARNSRIYKNEVALIERSPVENLRREITWYEFYLSANRFSNALAAAGIRKGDRVVQLMTNSLEWLPIYFGILNTGAWAVPLNFRFESDKILLCTEVAEAKVFVFGEEFIERLSGIRAILESTVHTWIFTGDPKLCPGYAIPYERLSESSSGDLLTDVEINIEDDAALYFTSATTGTPKAVLLTYRSL